MFLVHLPTHIDQQYSYIKNKNVTNKILNKFYYKDTRPIVGLTPGIRNLDSR